MTPRSVAAALHKDLAPHHAAAVSAPAAAMPFDFLQLLSDAKLQTNTAGNNTTSQQSNPPPVQPQKLKASDSTDANAALAALAAQVQQQQPQQPVSVNTALANAQTQATTTPAPAATPGTAAALAAAAAANKSDPNSQSGQTVPLPPGAADVEARVVKGAPNLVSQPSSMYAGLWHHAGEPTPQTPLTGADQGNAEPAATANDAPAQETDGAKAATLGPTLAAAAAHDDSAGASVASIAPDPTQGSDSTATSDTTGATSATAAAPVTADTQTAPAAVPGAPAIVTSAHVVPVYEQVAISLKQAAQAGDNRIEIQLKPASLGAIAVKLDMTHDGHITAVISADRSDTLNMLRQDSAGLQQALRDAGLQTDAGSLSFNLRGDAQSFAQNSPQQAAPASSSRSTLTASSLPDAPAARTRAHAGALDIEV